MARFLFLSWSHQGHVDYGGASFLRLARRLLDAGDEVSWALTQTGWGGATKRELERSMAAQQIPVSRLGEADLELPIPAPALTRKREPILSSVRTLAAFLADERVDVLVAERRCVLAGIAAWLAGVPWVAVGTDGQRWTDHFEKRGYYSLPGAFADSSASAIAAELGARGCPPELLQTSHLVSPFLNLSFFPRDFYGPPGTSAGAGPPCAHFVGSELRGEEAQAGGRVLVTLGNTGSRRGILTAFLRIVTLIESGKIRRPAPLTFLTGRTPAGAMLAPIAARKDWLVVRDWQPYFEAFSGVDWALGNGGAAFTWHALFQGAPVLIVGPQAGDQRFNGQQVQAHRLGVMLRVEPLELDAERVRDSVAFLESEETRERCRAWSRRLRSGGGVEAAAELCRRLAASGLPQDACADPRCCV
jgi:hypothetical protein